MGTTGALLLSPPGRVVESKLQVMGCCIEQGVVETEMVKRTAAIAVFLLALSLTAFADSITPTEPGGNTAVSFEYHRGKNHNTPVRSSSGTCQYSSFWHRAVAGM